MADSSFWNEVTQLTTGFITDVVSLTQPDHENKCWTYVSANHGCVDALFLFVLNFYCCVVKNAVVAV